MALLVSVRRHVEDELPLGKYPGLVLRYDELCRADDQSLIVKHRNNRWYTEEGEEYATLDVVGPFTIKGPGGETLGPYTTLSMFDGVAYVDKRVFAFTDVQKQDWYMHDVGVHWREMSILFRPTGP